MLWLLPAAALVVAFGWRRLGLLSASQRWTSVVLRLIVLAVCVLTLAGLAGVREHDSLTVVAVIDQSESVRRFGSGSGGVQAGGDAVSVENWARVWLERSASDRRQGDRFGVVTFDRRAAVKSLPSSDFQFDTGAAVGPVSGTDMAEAIRLATAVFPGDAAKRMVLVSDGNDTASADGGAVLAAAREARAAGVRIDVLPVAYRLPSEVAVEGLYAPLDGRIGQVVGLRVVLEATGPAEGVLQLKHNGRLVDLNGGQAGTGAGVGVGQWVDQEADAGGAGSRGFVWVSKIDLTLGDAGVNTFEAVFEPGDGGDTMAVNNSAESFTVVYGPSRVLLVESPSDASDTSLLSSWLSERGVRVDEVPAAAVPPSLARLRDYDALILRNTPASQISHAQQEIIAQYVHDLGGGLVMIGGPDGFGAGGWADTPVDRVLPVDSQIPNQTVLPSGVLLLVLDRSGSMGSPVAGSIYTKQELANEAAILALKTLYKQDMIGVIAFDSSPQWVVRLQLNSDPHAVAKQISRVQPGGGTEIYPALVEAYEAMVDLDTQERAIKHIVLLTDGQSPSSRYQDVAAKLAGAGITLSTIGVGSDVNATLLARLAQWGGGVYHGVFDPSKLPQVFIKEARTIRKNLIKEGVLQPRLVSTGSPMTAGIDAVPLLKGLVLTSAKQDPRVFLPIVGPEGEPVLAHWQVGLGHSAAFTSDATSRWCAAWQGWPGHGDFWVRAVRAIARPPASRDYDIATTVRDDTVHIRLDTAGGVGGVFAPVLRVAGTVLVPDGSVVRVELDQTEPGVYEASVGAAAAGNYIVSLFVQQEGGSGGAGASRSVVVGGVTRSAGEELSRFQSNPGLLREVARLTGGRVLSAAEPEAGTLFDRGGIEATRSLRPLWQGMVMVLIAAFLMDVAVRRLGLNPASVRQWVAQHGEAFSLWLAPRQATAPATLAALKRRAAEVDERLDGGRLGPGGVRGSGVGAETEATGAVEVAAPALDPPTADHPAPKRQAAEAPSSTSPPGSTTGRLLDAKRRAQERMDTDDR